MSSARSESESGNSLGSDTAARSGLPNVLGRQDDSQGVNYYVCIWLLVIMFLKSVPPIPNVQLFDCLMPTPLGTTYNSYLIVGQEKTALIDAVDPEKIGRSAQKPAKKPASARSTT